MNKIELAEITTDISLLEKLSDDKHWWVRAAVANNPNTPPELKTLMMLKY